MNWWQRSRRSERLSIQQSFKSRGTLFVVGVSLSVAIASYWGTNATNASNQNAFTVAADNKQQKDVEVTLVSFAVTKAAHDAIIPKFVQKWKQEHNQNVSFRTSYGGSGSQTRAVIDGLEADVVHLALALDTKRIETAGLIGAGWEKEVPNNGIVSKSVAALVTRPGNPKGIKNWSDLSKDGVSLSTLR